MRRMACMVVLAALLLAAVPASAGKVGFVEVERAAATVKQGQELVKNLQDWAKPHQEQLLALKQAAQDAKDQLAKQRGVASDEALQRMQDQAVAAQRRFEDAVRAFDRDYSAKQTEMLKPVADRMNTVISDYAKANGFDVVLIFKPRTIIYLAPTSDLTDTIIKLYDQRFPVTKGQ